MTQEREALRMTVRGLIADQGGTAIARGSGQSAWTALTGLGVTAALVPEHLGGLGLLLADAIPVVEELGRVAAPLPYISTAIGLGAALALADQDPAGIGEGICDGSLRGALAVLEPGRRADTSPTVTATRGRLTGTKVQVHDGSTADVLLVTAVDDEGPGAWVVRAAEARIEPTAQIDLTRPRATITLNDSPGTLLLRGQPLIDRLLDLVAAAVLADGIASAQAAFDMALDYTRTREQFGKPIGSFQAVQALCVEMFSGISLGRSSVEAAVTALDGQPWEEGHQAVVTARAWCAEHVITSLEDAVQIFAGIGFTWEHDVGLHYKRSLSLAIELGTAEDALEELAAELLA